MLNFEKKSAFDYPSYTLSKSANSVRGGIIYYISKVHKLKRSIKTNRI